MSTEDDMLFDILNDINKDVDSYENINNNICVNCKTDIHFVENYSEGTIVCNNCGIVHSEIIDRSPEWVNFDDSNKGSASRCSKMPTNSLNNTIGTSIACYNGSRLHILHKWSTVQYKEYTLNEVYENIRDKCRIASILKCIEDDAKILYKNITDIKIKTGLKKGKRAIIRGKNKISLIAACLYYACKRREHTRSPKEIASLFGIKDTEITKGCKIFLKLKNNVDVQYDLNSSTADHFIPRYCKDLHITEYIEDVMKIVKNSQKINLCSEHTPLSVAIGSILLISHCYKLNITKKILAAKFPVSEVTINKAYIKILEYKQILLDDDLTNKLVAVSNMTTKYIKRPKHLEDRYAKINNIQHNFNKENLTQINLSIDTPNFIDVINMMTFKLHKKIYKTNIKYYSIINNLQT
jgi:transcription initiation factor TFIIB